uniref:Uncharacterized protein n=1 Tax=Panagrolaimus sp. JU765 TaxID=591449 RepID=A0AC34R6T7_9BILA
MNPILSIFNFLFVLALVALPMAFCAPILGDAENELATFNFQNQPQFFTAPHKKWSRLEPSIRFFKRSGNVAPVVPVSPFEAGSEWVLLGTA